MSKVTALGNAIGALFERENLIAPGAGYGASADGQRARPDVLPPGAIEAMRTAGLQVLAIGMNARQERIVLFLSKAPTAKVRSSVPGEIDGVEIVLRAQQVSAIRPGRPSARPRAQAAVVPTGARIPCGSSISPGNARIAGTLGAIVADADGTLYGLTCNHVTGGCNNVPRGMPVVSPGVLHVSSETRTIDVIGYQHSFLPLRQGLEDVLEGGDNADAALVKLSNPDAMSSTQNGAGDTPDTVIAPAPGMAVCKVGAQTAKTRGLIDTSFPHQQAYDFEVPIRASNVIRFKGVCTFPHVWRVDGSGFAERGDSGALVTTDPEREPYAAVGLLFAAADNGDGLILPLAPILKALDVRLVSSHNP